MATGASGQGGTGQGATGQGGTGVAVATGAAGDMDAARELGDRVAAASRKMFHDDGEGCLEDLQRVGELDSGMLERLAVTQGQCEMLVGKCQEGKTRISAWYQREMAMTTVRADEMAEQLGAMRCRGGDSSQRDRLLGALYELSDAAYMNPRDVAYCEARVKTVLELEGKVKAQGPRDSQISGGKQALFHTAAACLVAAGDCRRAEARFRELFPREGLDAITDPALREKVLRESFESSFESCAAGSGPSGK